ncbi:MAG: hypothetical protein QF864_08520, partial [SAR202 cluster bacterium]|nr:hypothetical protein [SAR202 cluster bacterium]
IGVEKIHKTNTKYIIFCNLDDNFSIMIRTLGLYLKFSQKLASKTINMVKNCLQSFANNS